MSAISASDKFGDSLSGCSWSICIRYERLMSASEAVDGMPRMEYGSMVGSPWRSKKGGMVEEDYFLDDC